MMLTHDSVLNRKYLWCDYPLVYFDPGHGYAGWRDIMDKFLGAVEQRCNEAGLPLGSPEAFSIMQVKEKWGSLSIYCSGAVKSFDLCIAADESSSRVCMRCGAPGSLRTGSWHLTLCDDCHADRMRQHHASQTQQ